MLCFLILSILLSNVFAEYRVDIFGIAKCPDTSKFYKQQLLPFFRSVSDVPVDVKIHYHPVPSVVSVDENGVVHNKCLHGPEECKLNKLQVCTRYVLEEVYKISPLETLVKVTCIQGRRTFNAASVCIDTHQKEIFECAGSEKGEELLFEEYHERAVFAPHSEWLPAVSFNGKSNYEAVSNFKRTICNLDEMKDVPECASER